MRESVAKTREGLGEEMHLGGQQFPCYVTVTVFLIGKKKVARNTFSMQIVDWVWDFAWMIIGTDEGFSSSGYSLIAAGTGSNS